MQTTWAGRNAGSKLWVAGIVVAAVVAVAAGWAAPPVAGANVTWPSGVFSGYGTAGLAPFAAWRGAPVTVATDFMGGPDWSAFEDPAWTISQWASDKAVTPDLTLGLWPGLDGSLSDAASGEYDDHYHALARNLVAAGLGGVALRPGWEFNGTWYPWSVTSTTAGEFATAWRHLVTAMRSVPGANFTFVWCPTLATSGVDPSLAYPGDAYVSVIGLDVYDGNLTGPGESPSQRWSDLVHARYGLNWQAGFAAAHGKPIGFPEWGLLAVPLAPATAGGDDPTFVQNMFDWFGSHNVAFEDYFNADAGALLLGPFLGLTIGNGLLPNAVALYRQLYSTPNAAALSRRLNLDG